MNGTMRVLFIILKVCIIHENIHDDHLSTCAKEMEPCSAETPGTSGIHYKRSHHEHAKTQTLCHLE